MSKQILEDKQEVMLEPMNSVDRKTLHDAAATFDGIRSYSEGREPYRSVVFAPEEEEWPSSPKFQIGVMSTKTILKGSKAIMIGCAKQA